MEGAITLIQRDLHMNGNIRVCTVVGREFECHSAAPHLSGHSAISEPALHFFVLFCFVFCFLIFVFVRS